MCFKFSYFTSVYVFTLCFQLVISLQEINACPEYSNFSIKQELKLPWVSPFHAEEITFRLIDNAPICTNGEDYVTFDEQIFKSSEYPYFTPAGYIATQMGLHAHYFSPREYCVLIANRTYLKAKVCKPTCNDRAPCIKKCCPVGESINLKGLESPTNSRSACTASGNNSWKPFFYKYDRSNNIIPIADDLKIAPHYLHFILNCSNQLEPLYTRDFKGTPRIAIKLLTDGSLMFVGKERKWRKLNVDKFCLDGLQDFGEGEFYSGSDKDQVVVLCSKESKAQRGHQSWAYMIVMYIASIFLLMTCVVYILLWKLHNIHGWTVFNLVLSMYFMFVFLATAHLLAIKSSSDNSKDYRNSTLCILNGILAHFFFLSTFTWLSVMNIDLWRTFKSFASMSERHNGKKRFLTYLPFAWGIPTVVVIVGFVLNKLYPFEQEQPENTCFSFAIRRERDSLVVVPEYGDDICDLSPWARGIYLYYIIACLLTLNFVLIATTFFNLYQFKKGISSLKNNKSSKHTQTFLLVGKLSVIMGVSWIFEVISWAASEDYVPWWWFVADMFNLLQAVLIFIIFICKPDTIHQLEQTYPTFKNVLAPLKKLITSTNRTLESENAAANMHLLGPR